MRQRLSIVTLGVRNLPRSIAFFEQLGWRRSVAQAEGIAFFQCGGMALALYPRADLAEDVGVPPEGTGFSGITLAHNTASRVEVDQVLAEVAALGAEIAKPAQEAVWGGYSGYFRDLDGHLWEVAWNPGFALAADGALSLPD